MRTIIELPDETVDALDQLRRATGRSRAALVREAVEHYLEGRSVDDRAAAFGAWRDLDIDGLDLQRRLRAEWGETEP